MKSPKDASHIDRLYRTRDTGLAKRGLKELNKTWNADDATVEEVLQYQKGWISQNKGMIA
jgi:hypothetical protein